jgi:hypothetical protein
MARSPDPKGRADDLELARKRTFVLDDVDFAVVSKIVRHAEGRTQNGKAAHVTLERDPLRRPPLLWTVAVDVAGEYESFPYTPDGEPLAEERLDFIAAPNAATRRIVETLGAKARVLEVLLQRDYALVEVMAPKSERDTDRYRFSFDGVVSGPEPQVSDGKPEDLAPQIFPLEAIDWPAARAAAADAAKHLEAEVQSVTIRRVGGEVTLVIYARSDRGATRTATYDAKGKRRDP